MEEIMMNLKLPRRQFLQLTAGAAALPALLRIARAQTGPAPSKAGTRLITLGTRGGPNPTVWRAQSSNILIVNGAFYIIDAGDGITRRLTRAKIVMRNIDTMFITHPHSDHTGGLPALLQVQYDTIRTKPVNIYGPPGTEALVKALVRYLDVDAEVRISDGTRTVMPSTIFSGHDKGTGSIFQDANIKVTAVENSHYNFPPQSPGYGKYKSYAYRFDTADRSIVFTGDTGPSEPISVLAKGADMLVSEVTSIEEWKEQQIRIGRWQAMTPAQQEGSLRHMMEEHLTTEEVGKMAERAGVKIVVLTHLPATGNPKDEYARFAEQVKKHFSGQVLVAKDLMEF
jgi:ribonuclease BN (tRNA processing enzyme)